MQLENAHLNAPSTLTGHCVQFVFRTLHSKRVFLIISCSVSNGFCVYCEWNNKLVNFFRYVKPHLCLNDAVQWIHCLDEQLDRFQWYTEFYISKFLI